MTYPSPPCKGLIPAQRVTENPALGRFLFCCVLLLTVLSVEAQASERLNRLYRLGVKSQDRYTRLTFVFADQPRYQVSYLPGQKLQITFQDTAGPSLKKYQAFSDSHIAGIMVTDQGRRLRVRFSYKETQPGVRVLNYGLPTVLTVDIGNALQVNGEAAMPPGREQIWQGAAKLIREFDPPLKSDIPFFPMPGVILKKIMPPEDLKLFLRGEAALFREQGAEAEEIFTDLAGRVPAARALAAYRLGEAQYLLQKYQSALNWFKEGERLAPEFLVQSPSIVFAYADSLARCGESDAGRRILDRMIVSMADTRYGPFLLVRLADILSRGGRNNDAWAVYRSVAQNFPGSRAALLASARLADRRLFHVNAGSFSSLAEEYKRIYLQTTEPGLKEEALFKWALLNSLYGAATEAVAAVTDYGGKFPSGIFSNVAKSMREDLLLLLFRELDRAGNCQRLVKLALDHQPYLSRCVADSDFIPHLSACFSKLGMVREELSLFSSLAETAWVGQNVPFLYQRIVEDAWQLDDFALVAGAAKTYLSSYAGHGAAPMIRERLAWILYRNRDLRGVYATLLPLMYGKGTVTDPQSYYFFGKASENLGEKVRAEKAMERYLAAIPSGSGTALAADARLVMAAALQSRKATVAAIAVLQGGYDASTGERRDMFLFKMGELYQASGKLAEATARWQKLVDEGKDPVWKSMAYQSLTDLQWRRKWQEPGTSK